MQESIPGSIASPSGNQIAYVRTNGKTPGVVFCGGYMSDMTGTKALSLEALCREINHSFLRFDYSGHGASGGLFKDGTISSWTQDTLTVLDKIVTGPQILVGSSMGGWIILLVALARKNRVQGLVGIAPAADFTQRLLHEELTCQQLTTLHRDGLIKIKSPYDEDPYVFTKALLEDGMKHRILNRTIELHCPVRFLHGMEDDSVPWQYSLELANSLSSNDVEITLIKDGDHRLSEEDDIARLRQTVVSLIEATPA